MKTKTTIILTKQDIEGFLKKELKERGLKLANFWFFSIQSFLSTQEPTIEIHCEPVSELTNIP